MMITVKYDRDPGLDTIWYGRRLETVRIAIADDGAMTETIEQWSGAPTSCNHYLLPVDPPDASLTDAQRAAIRTLAERGNHPGYHMLKWLDGAKSADRVSDFVHGDNLRQMGADAAETAVEATGFDRRDRHYPDGA